MLKLTLLAAALLAVCVTATYVEQFEAFKAKYGRKYPTVAEEAKRLRIFVENMKTAAELQAANPLATFGVNEFADISAAEFKVRHNADRSAASRAAFDALPVSSRVTPRAGESIDWRTKGAVTPVKNQGQCGSCWSFSTTGNIEGQWFLAGNKLTSLSEQQLVSCDTTNDGCNGGDEYGAMAFILEKWSGKIDTEASYPYVSGSGVTHSCQPYNRTTGATINGRKKITQTEEAMADFVYTYGPLSIAVDANTWQTYTGGIMTKCPKNNVDHAVLAVGFDLSYSTPYWIIKNSWATDWGEKGYIRVAYGTNDLCAITSEPVTVEVNKK